MPTASDSPGTSITEAFVGGEFTYELAHHGNRHVRASDDEVQAVLRYARRCIKNNVAPALEKVVKDSGVPVDDDRHSHAEDDRNIHAGGSIWSEHVDCEIVAPVPDAVIGKVQEVVERELFGPVENFIRGGKPEYDGQETRRLVKAVRGLGEMLSRRA